MALPDFEILARADAETSPGIRGRWRILRRLIQRSLLDRSNRNQLRYFCQNSGACGSHYVVDLLRENGIERVFHEKDPDLNEIGVRHFDTPISLSELVSILRYTRHNVFFEANNRLFSLSRELATAFPGARFIHLFRHPANAVRSAMSKPNIDGYLRSNVRFSGSLAGNHDQRPLERFCLYWNNMNERIYDDLLALQVEGVEVMWLNFDNLISGKVQRLEEFMGHKLPKKKSSPSHVGAVRDEGKFEEFERWSPVDKAALENHCLPLFRTLVSKAAD